MSINFRKTKSGISDEHDLIGDGWRDVVLEDLASEITVGYVGPMASEYVEDGIPFLRSQNVSYLTINTQDIKYITPEFHQRLKKSSLKPGDVVIVRTGKPGTCAVIPPGLSVANCSDLVIVRCGCTLDAYFLAYFVNSIASHHVAAHLVGAVQQHFNVGSARTIHLNLPHIEEQEVIVSFLRTLDNKIELNQQMNETLEAIGQAVFKRWFVDFEFPNQEGEPYTSSGGEMVYNSALDKEIPEGWKVKPIDEIADFLNGLALQKFPARNGEEYLPVIKIRELRQGITESSDKANLDLPKEYIVKNGDVLFSWSGSLEVVIWGFGKGALNQHLFKVTSSKYPKWFFYYWILQFLPEYRQIAAGKATTMGHIQRHHLTASKVTIPNDKTIERMNIVLAPILERIVHLKVETRTLVVIRDLLLPRLMSGKIRVTLPNEKQETT